jgi:hypothetical protein
MRLPALLLCTAVALAAAEKIPPPGKPVLVWDGDGNAVGNGWAKSEPDKSKTDTEAPEAAKGKKAMRLHVEADSWSRHGWRWIRPEDKIGTSVKPYQWMVFQFKATGQALPTAVKVVLVSADKDGKRVEGPEVDLAMHCPKALGGGKAWIPVALPLARLIDQTGFDQTNITEVMFVTNGGKGMNADLLVDEIGFAKAAR